MNVYYWNKVKNFGDLLTPLLLKKFTRLEATFSDENPELVMVGSVLEHIPSDWTGVVAGAGKLHESSKIELPNARILGVRGYLSAKGLKGDLVLGDPGLLADELVGIQEKKYDLGLVPHWTDKTLELNPIFKQFKPKIIRVGDDPLEVIRQIGQCKRIVSSSLHGIITADAFSIPRRIEIPPRALSHPHQEGGLFKWKDYSSSIDEKLVIGVMQQIRRTKIIDKQHELFDLMEEVKKIFTQS